jgi:hypothetical protein
VLSKVGPRPTKSWSIADKKLVHKGMTSRTDQSVQENTRAFLQQSAQKERTKTKRVREKSLQASQEAAQQRKEAAQKTLEKLEEGKWTNVSTLPLVCLGRNLTGISHFNFCISKP